MTYTPQHIANFFLEKAESENRFLDPLKLIKLVYFGYGWNLALKNERLFSEEIEAWKHGPVIPSIYHEFKEFGDRPITRRAYDLDLDTLEMYAPRIKDGDAETHLILDKVWDAYKSFSGWSLRDKTHEEGSPWWKVYNTGSRNAVLQDADISEHFVEKISGYLRAAKEIHERRTS